MGDNTGIEWTDATWQPITGCSVVSPGCTNCYAMRLAGTRLQHHPSRAGLTTMSKAGPVWNGQVRLNEQWLTQPIAWKRPRRIFVCAHGDLFHESIPDEWIDRVFAVVALCPQHTFQVLTKRNKRMRDYCSNHRVLPNVWLGVSCEDQQRVNERIPDLLDTPAAVRWVSAEPLLGPIDFEIPKYGLDYHNVCQPWFIQCLNWIVVGGESGHGSRPMHPDWARSIRDQCAAADVPFFFKQWGEFKPLGAIYDDSDADVDAITNADPARSFALAPNGSQWSDGDGQPPSGSWMVERVGKRLAGHLLDGRAHVEFPADKHRRTR